VLAAAAADLGEVLADRFVHVLIISGS